MIERPVVTETEQGVDAVKQDGVIAHNDIPAATNDRTDAPRLDVDPRAEDANSAPASAMEGELQPDSGPLDGSGQNEAIISAAAAGETPSAVAQADAERLYRDALEHASEERTQVEKVSAEQDRDMALVENGIDPDARQHAPGGSLDPVLDVQPGLVGVWQCQNPKCTSAFEAGTQTEIRASNVPLHCPKCNGDHVLYIGEK